MPKPNSIIFILTKKIKKLKKILLLVIQKFQAI